MQRQEDWLLRVVRWSYPDDASKPHSLAEVGLKEMTCRWKDYDTADAARSELERRCVASPPPPAVGIDK